jgi:hypothetical protein
MGMNPVLLKESSLSKKPDFISMGGVHSPSFPETLALGGLRYFLRKLCDFARDGFEFGNPL